MPELPEVETTIRDLQKKVLKRTFLDVWTDARKIIKKPRSFEEFRKNLKGTKIKNIWRRGKNIIFELSDNRSLLIHQKLTGHLLCGKWKQNKGKWEPLKRGPLEESVNRYIHLVFWLSGDLMLALSDLRKFAKVELWRTEELRNSRDFKKIGPEPLEKSFTYEKFKDTLKNKKGKTPRPVRGKMKQILMDQSVIAGIGNIYSDEILWEAKIHPFREVSKLKEEELEKIYKYIKEVLKKAIKLRGTSISDYRDPEGKSGFFVKALKVYQREGEKCSRCGTIIKRLKMAGRSAHFCPNCQKL